VRNVKGFTLIELVMVIVILGLLSAVALPKFANLKGDAEKVSAKAFMASYKTAVNSARLLWQTSGQVDTVTLESSVLAMGTVGWPKAQPNSTTGCINLWNNVLQSPPSITTYSNNLSDTAESWSTIGYEKMCIYYYQNGKSLNYSKTPFFVYYSTQIGSIAAGTFTEYNMD